ncbi:hypothetical protein V6N13_004804 [Hibiscus sabdariffa]
MTGVNNGTVSLSLRSEQLAKEFNGDVGREMCVSKVANNASFNANAKFDCHSYEACDMNPINVEKSKVAQNRGEVRKNSKKNEVVDENLFDPWMIMENRQ